MHRASGQLTADRAARGRDSHPTQPSNLLGWVGWFPTQPTQPSNLLGWGLDYGRRGLGRPLWSSATALIWSDCRGAGAMLLLRTTLDLEQRCAPPPAWGNTAPPSPGATYARGLLCPLVERTSKPAAARRSLLIFWRFPVKVPA
eukprot:180079-Chlamydomonas_euryale.AAC.3